MSQILPEPIRLVVFDWAGTFRIGTIGNVYPTDIKASGHVKITATGLVPVV